MAQDEASSSSMTSTPLNHFMAISPNTPASLYSALREYFSNERGMFLIQVLYQCAKQVAAGSFDLANECVEHILPHASPEGDTMQRIAAVFTDALSCRLLKPWSGLSSAVCMTSRRLFFPAEVLHARRHFFDLCPFLKLAFVVSNQAIMEAIEGESFVHIVDLCVSEPDQWLALLQALKAWHEKPPQLRITGVHERKEVLDHISRCLSEEAERLDISFQFTPVVSKLENLNVENLSVKTGEALVVSSVLQMHCLLASEDNAASLRRTPTPTGKSPIVPGQLQMFSPTSHRTLADFLHEKEFILGCSPSPDSASCSPFPIAPMVKLENFLAWLSTKSPKIVVLTEQESNHNGPTMYERFSEALLFYSTLFDCLEWTVPRASAERRRLEVALFGEEIRNIISCEGAERRERHEPLERWALRMGLRGFRQVPLSYYGQLQARHILQSFNCQGYKIRDENGCVQFCWRDRALFSVSAWR